MGNIATITKYVRGLIHDNLAHARDSFVYLGDTRFHLSEDFPVEATITLFKNGTELTVGWSYDSSTNDVYIDVTGVVDDVIEVVYDYYGKYSDAEIKGYIESALSYFSEYHFAKVFAIDDDDVVVELDTGTLTSNIPTSRELRFIARITGLLINPDNKDIKTSEITIITKGSKSREELISDAFSKYMRYVGTVVELVDPDAVTIDGTYYDE